MSRLDNPPARMTVRPGVNVYTGLAFVAMIALRWQQRSMPGCST